MHISEDKAIIIGSELEPYVKSDISKVLTQYLNSFASKAIKIIGVDPQVTLHSLKILPGMKLVV